MCEAFSTLIISRGIVMTQAERNAEILKLLKKQHREDMQSRTSALRALQSAGIVTKQGHLSGRYATVGAKAGKAKAREA